LIDLSNRSAIESAARSRDHPLDQRLTGSGEGVFQPAGLRSTIRLVEVSRQMFHISEQDFELESGARILDEIPGIVAVNAQLTGQIVRRLVSVGGAEVLPLRGDALHFGGVADAAQPAKHSDETQNPHHPVVPERGVLDGGVYVGAESLNGQLIETCIPGGASIGNRSLSHGGLLTVDR
jgi:hypothetical protein